MALQDNCFGMAAQLAYYFFLSLFPALLIVVALTSSLPSHVLDSIPVLRDALRALQQMYGTVGAMIVVLLWPKPDHA